MNCRRATIAASPLAKQYKLRISVTLPPAQQFLVHRSRDVGKDSCPVHRRLPIRRVLTMQRIVRNTASLKHESADRHLPE